MGGGVDVDARLYSSLASWLHCDTLYSAGGAGIGGAGGGSALSGPKVKP